MNMFEYQLKNTTPCSGVVSWAFGRNGRTDQEIADSEKEYKEHVGQKHLRFLYDTDPQYDPFVSGQLRTLWECDLEEFIKNHEFVKYADDENKFPIVRRK